MEIYDAVFNSELDDKESADQEAMDYARGMCWGEVGITSQSIGYKDLIGEVYGVNVWYDYGADYYFFEETEPDTEEE